MTTYLGRHTPCPYCGKSNDAQTETKPGSGPPKAGSISLCWGCHCLGIFEDGPDGLQIRKPTKTEMEEIVQDTHVRGILQGMGMARTPYDVQEG